MKKIIMAILAVFVIAAYVAPASAQVNLNSYLDGVATFGYKTATAGTDVVHNIPYRSGQRIVVLGGEFWTGATAHTAYFMYPEQTSTLDSAVAVGDSFIYIADSLTDNGGNIMAANDFLMYVADDGSQIFVTCSTYTAGSGIYKVKTKMNELAAKAAASGNAVFYFGVETDGNEYAVYLPDSSGTIGTSATQNVVQLPPAAIFGDGRGRPMKMIMQNATAAGKCNYLSIGYTDK